MAYEQKPGQGSIFKNDKKEQPNHPDYKGTMVTPDGVECWVSVWVKRPEGKQPFMSLSVQPKETQSQAPAPIRKAEVQTAVVIDDGLPF